MRILLVLVLGLTACGGDIEAPEVKEIPVGAQRCGGGWVTVLDEGPEPGSQALEYLCPQAK